MTPPSPDAAPAHALWVQLATRITTQPLHYRSGDEETAAKSIYSLFEKVRELLEAHPDAAEFRKLAVGLLNDTLRAYTARWHGWMTEDEERRDADGKAMLCFRDEQVRRQFRQELKALQPQLKAARRRLAELAGVSEQQVDGRPRHARLGKGLVAGIGGQVEIAGDQPDSDAVARQINEAEHATLLERRRALRSHTQASGSLVDATGLALSGGGIRSATFCLGIVQALVRKGLLLEFDYLSTVSGGGYFGSFLSCALGTRPQARGGKKSSIPNQQSQAAATVEASPSPAQESAATDAGDAERLQHARSAAAQRVNAVFHRQEEASQQKGIESALVRHLRNNSKYLLGGDSLGKLRIVGLLLSGVLWNVMIVLPIPLFAALLAFLLGPWVWKDAAVAGGPVVPAITGSPSGWALAVLGSLLCLGWLALPGIQLLTHGKPPKSKGAMFRSVWETTTLLLGLLTVAAGVIYLLPALFHGHEWLRVKLSELSLGALDLKKVAGLLPASVTGVAGAVLAALAGWLSPRWQRLRVVVVRLFILTGPLLFLLVFLLVGNRIGLVREGCEPWNPVWVGAATIALAAWGWFFVNINTLAPHRYYRSRLCECYLARRLPKDTAPSSARVCKLSGETVQGSVEVLKQVPLTKLGEDLTAPYHLINMTVNVPTSADKNLRGRASDFFFASRHFAGSPITGYERMEKLEEADPHFDLGTAMAVSGAAASTSMGWHTLPHFRFLMTLFNVRLGYWLRRPGVPNRNGLLEGAGPWYLFREMLGSMDEQCRYVNLSDGGHIENLAAYELLRRRCKFIVCVDAGHEPGMECADLVRLQRYAEIDLGIRMRFDAADLQLGSNGLSRAHAILVKIDYDPDPTTREEADRCSDRLGWMLYLKLAMTGVEPNDVKDYRRQHPEFPHEPTGDQTYEEEQFEAYRALGECAMEGMFREEIVGPQAPRTMRGWFQHLADNLLPDNDEAFRR